MPTFLKSAPSATFADTSHEQVRESVRTMIAGVCDRGEEAVQEYAAKFDHWTSEFRLSPSRVEEIIGGLPSK